MNFQLEASFFFVREKSVVFSLGSFEKPQKRLLKSHLGCDPSPIGILIYKSEQLQRVDCSRLQQSSASLKGMRISHAAELPKSPPYLRKLR